ncbi:MAG: Nramp family divalent metal transporter [Ignavibacteria bacterium]|jgi:manganese transport protein|nr:Nramp family divalent metal transporter [Ignavibacteria bacterium]MCU7505189.1 Nramp family divalent metal transporter [Ignavibacteria bacterium]MCU7518092.1 Nramp family divalent metal transporter [Ignavibacteria bacterium]
MMEKVEVQKMPVMEKVEVRKRGWWRRLLAFVGPAYLVSVGYMDPGNWATDLEGGARFGYALVWVLLMSNLMAVLLQTLSARLGIVTGYDLAQGCRKEYPKPVGYVLWFLAEIAIAATDLAEVIGTILGLNMLFGLPLLWGCAVTAFDTFLLLAIQRLGVRKMEAFIVMLIGTIALCFLIELAFVSPDWGGVVKGFIPSLPNGALYVAIGIIGATVMPHNLYLHSSLVQSRAIPQTYTGKAEACKFNLLDSAVALNAAFFVNAAILVLSAATFFSRGIEVTEIQQAHNLLKPILGTAIAPAMFAIALLAAGQSSTLTGTISGQVVMEGFLNFKMRPWLRRVLTRGIALLPAVVVIAISGSQGIYQLLILSQVVLSLQLPFAVIPLVHFTSDAGKMGSFTNKLWVKIAAWVVSGAIVVLNLKLVSDTMAEFSRDLPLYYYIFILAGAIFLGAVLLYILFAPILGKRRVWESGIVTRGQSVAKGLTHRSIRHIGVALENGPGDNDVISMALSLARPDHSIITLIHVLESPGTYVYGDESDSRHFRQDEAYMEELVREVEKPGLPVEICLKVGNPVQVLIATARELKLDMLVMGSHGHTGLSDIIFGQTITGVRHALEIPVLTVRVSDTRVETPEVENSLKNGETKKNATSGL